MKFNTEQFTVTCGCRSVGECQHNNWDWQKALDACVDAFAAEMKRKLYRKACEGKSGWDDPSWPVEDMRQQLVNHVAKGDPVDVANFAMFIWNRDDEAKAEESNLLYEKGDRLDWEDKGDEGNAEVIRTGSIEIVMPRFYKDDEECGYCMRPIGHPHDPGCRQ